LVNIRYRYLSFNIHENRILKRLEYFLGISVEISECHKPNYPGDVDGEPPPPRISLEHRRRSLAVVA
jgi:hypothetical protein